jgi:hypothetical protein
MNHYLENDAVISDCGKYRYLLRRTWDHSKPRALLIMLNPSTADAKLDDPTIRSCVRLISGLHYGSMEVVNIFGWRATYPDELPKQADPIGPMNERIVDAAIRRCDVVICAWGANAMAARKSQYLCARIQSVKPGIYCFGTTKSGAPKHPLYVKSGTPLVTFRPQ